jgi:hypothetical protein
MISAAALVATRKTNHINLVIFIFSAHKCVTGISVAGYLGLKFE